MNIDRVSIDRQSVLVFLHDHAYMYLLLFLLFLYFPFRSYISWCLMLGTLCFIPFLFLTFFLFGSVCTPASITLCSIIINHYFWVLSMVSCLYTCIPDELLWILHYVVQYLYALLQMVCSLHQFFGYCSTGKQPFFI